MFAFDKPYEIIEKNILIDDLREKYPDNIMITINGHIEEERRHGDVIAILTEEEYTKLRKNFPVNYSSKFATIKGINILRDGREGWLGVFL